jgi:hypothetical protein
MSAKHKAPRKPDPERSPLRSLPEDRQAAIMEMSGQVTLEAASRSLAADGIKASPNCISSFRQWYFSKQRSTRTNAVVESILEDIKANNPQISRRQLFAHGQKMFSALAIADQDASDWARIQRLNLRDDMTEVERQKFQRQTCELFLKWFADKQAVQIVNSPAGNDEKIERLGKTMFGEDW